jgi:hypothetical protein
MSDDEDYSSEGSSFHGESDDASDSEVMPKPRRSTRGSATTTSKKEPPKSKSTIAKKQPPKSKSTIAKKQPPKSKSTIAKKQPPKSAKESTTNAVHLVISDHDSDDDEDTRA